MRGMYKRMSEEQCTLEVPIQRVDRCRGDLPYDCSVTVPDPERERFRLGKTAGDAAIDTAEQNLDSRFQDGTYSGSGEGYRGTVTVSVKVEQGTITGLTIENAEDDQTYLDRAKSGIFRKS